MQLDTGVDVDMHVLSVRTTKARFGATRNASASLSQQLALSKIPMLTPVMLVHKEIATPREADNDMGS